MLEDMMLHQKYKILSSTIMCYNQVLNACSIITGGIVRSKNMRNKKNTDEKTESAALLNDDHIEAKLIIGLKQCVGASDAGIGTAYLYVVHPF